MLTLTRAVYNDMIAHALSGLPDEACGLMVGRLNDGSSGSSAADSSAADSSASAFQFEPCTNTAKSSRIYSIDPKEFMKIDRRVEDDELDIVGVMHSHTHTEPYPSVTDVNQAPDPGWHYVIVSLRDTVPMLRSYRIVDAEITEESVAIDGV